MMETYAQQRKCRLADVILDYLDDEEVSARRFYEDLLAETSEMIDYHQRHAKKYEEFRELIQGHRLIDSFESD